jgi:predicted HTH transcriptional regulator
MDSELHLPWLNEALENLALKMIQTGEANKVDFKRQLNIGTPAYDAELLKDISALANTYDHSYDNHGFIIIGVADKQLSYATFAQNEDALQARIDQLIRNNVEPFISTQVRIFGKNPETWGLVVVPPTHTAPHVFSKDIDKRCRGEIFVRRGTITEKAIGHDFARFFRLHLDEHTYTLRQKIDGLSQEVASIQELLRTKQDHKSPKPKQKIQAGDQTIPLEPETRAHLINRKNLPCTNLFDV